MKGNFPIIACDSEDGCTEWTLDWYQALASNWRDLMEPGWQYEPYQDRVPHLCPSHNPENR